MIRIDNMFPDVIFDDLRHEAVHCAARSDDQVKDVGAAFFFLDRVFERLHLAENTSHSVQQLGLLFDGVPHISRNLGTRENVYTQGCILYMLSTVARVQRGTNIIAQIDDTLPGMVFVFSC
jgi:hypothetical protein